MRKPSGSVSFRLGRWTADYVDSFNKRRQLAYRDLRDETSKRQKKEATKRLCALLERLEQGGDTDGKLTVASLVRQFIVNHSGPKVRQSTLESYEKYERLHIIPHIGSMIAREFRRKDAEMWRATLLAKPTAKQPKGAMSPPRTLSPAVVKNTMQVAFAAFKWGLGHEMVLRNPFTGVARPTGRKDLPDPFTAIELDLVIENLDERWRLPGEFMAYTGLRIGELLALQWENIDWVEKTVLISRNWTGKKFEPCKTGSSRRTIEIPDHLVHRLKVWKLKCPPGELMFPSPTGHIDNEANFNNRGVTPACRRAGVRRRTPHQFRHTYATLQLAAGENLSVVSKQLGHANPAITLKIYRHVLPNEGKGLNNRMAARVREARKGNGDDSVTSSDVPTSDVGVSRLSS